MTMDVRTICLGLLSLGDASGYEIKKIFEDSPLHHFFGAGYGSIYPALNDLTEEGLLTCTQRPQKGRPDKKVYGLTPTGRLTFAEAILQGPGTDRLRSEFLVTMMFSDLLEPNQLSRMLDERIEGHRTDLAVLTPGMLENGNIGQNFVAGYIAAIHQAAADYLEQERHILEGQTLTGRRYGK